ncbi:MAG: hypothetical protein COV35_05960 [Alphaproteobacteria bacterium CG11_big_fil_rev_8_21_14_0_20_39_49]|nr:MAG: hypothetical protein COV35_05960 [Alphaproteobacteria bacterium CG11_big_fil_rev_8_21_14_0_20_39_49]
MENDKSSKKPIIKNKGEETALSKTEKRRQENVKKALQDDSSLDIAELIGEKVTNTSIKAAEKVSNKANRESELKGDKSKMARRNLAKSKSDESFFDDEPKTPQPRKDKRGLKYSKSSELQIFNIDSPFDNLKKSEGEGKESRNFEVSTVTIAI